MLVVGVGVGLLFLGGKFFELFMSHFLDDVEGFIGVFLLELRGYFVLVPEHGCKRLLGLFWDVVTGMEGFDVLFASSVEEEESFLEIVLDLRVLVLVVLALLFIESLPLITDGGRTSQ